MNPTPLDIERLRWLSIEQPGPAPRALALVVSSVLLLTVLNLVRRGRLREEYTPIWVTLSLGIMVLAVWFDALRFLTRAIGAWTPSSTLYFFGVVSLLVLCLNYAVRLSALSGQVKLLAQETALLRAALERRGAEPPA
jgi:hypothetical protein